MGSLDNRQASACLFLGARTLGDRAGCVKPPCVTGFGALPLYDLPEIDGATTRFFQAIVRRIRAEGVDVDNTRVHDDPPRYRDSRLLFAQVCGRPLVTELSDVLEPIAAPVFSSSGCAPGHYRSAIVATASELSSPHQLRGRRVAVNGFSSHSGWSALVDAVGVASDEVSHAFSRITVTGSHAASIEAVLQGHCEGAAVDAVSLDLLGRHRPAMGHALRVIGWSLESWAPPFVVRRDSRVHETVYRAIEGALQDIGRETREALGLSEIRRVELSDYESIARLAAASPPPQSWRTVE